MPTPVRGLEVRMDQAGCDGSPGNVEDGEDDPRGAARLERERGALPVEALGRVHGPAGLDLGGRAPEQVALAIAAEIQAAMAGASATALSRTRASAAGPAPQPSVDGKP
jgi:xanthine dehydrogenase accessory factor